MTWARSSFCDSNACVEVDMYQKSSFCVSDACVEVDMFHKSSYSNTGNCVEVDVYQKSSFCGPGECVEISFHKAEASSNAGSCVETRICTCPEILVRDSKDPDGPVLSFTRDEWAAFLAGVHNMEFELPVA